MFRKKKKKSDAEKMVDAMVTIKQDVESVYAMARGIDQINESNGVASPGSAVVYKAIVIDLVSFMLYLSASDGEVDESEVDTINTFLNMRLTRSDCVQIINENNIYSEDFESTVPTSFQLLKSLSKNVGFPGDLPGALIGLYRRLGALLIVSDGSIDPQEQKDFDIFMSTLERNRF